MTKKHNIVYKLTNLINGHYYIGKHITDDINDNYMGSGKLISQAIEKYGPENFKKEILFDLPTEQAAFEKEKELMPLEKTHYYDPNCYNLVEGGCGGIMTDETKEKIRKTNQQYCGEKHSQYGKPKSQETREKIAKSVSLKTKGSQNGMFGKKLKDFMSPEHYNQWKQTRLGCKWYNNGEKSKFFKPTDIIPDGWKPGRIMKKHK